MNLNFEWTDEEFERQRLLWRSAFYPAYNAAKYAENVASGINYQTWRAEWQKRLNAAPEPCSDHLPGVSRYGIRQAILRAAGDCVYAARFER